MKLIFCMLVICLSYKEIVCPPVAPNPQPVEGNSPEEDPGFGLEYDRYLREVVQALEEDETFRKKLEETNISDIKSGKIAMHLDLVSHQIRERLDEIKRQEIQRLRMLAREKMNKMNGIQKMDQFYPHHVDVKNPHSFEMKDLENLIKKATSDLDEIDRKRKMEFQQYEMEKEHLKREELNKLNEEDRKKKIEEYEEMKKRHQQHPPVHHPGSKKQLEDVWEKTDNMDPDDFDPKTFFKLHDLSEDGFLDQDEIEALFQKELDQVYDPNMPEDDMRERYEDMSRMREHVFGELDHDKDRLISMAEFLNYTASSEFEKDEEWKTVDEQQNFTEEEFLRFEEELRRRNMDPNMVQPGVVPLGHDPVQQMEMPHGQPGLNQQQQHAQQQQQLHFQAQQQLQQQQMGQMPVQGQMPGQMPVQGQMPGQMPVQGQMPGQMPGHGQVPQAQMPGQVPVQGQMPGQVPVQGQMPGQVHMGQGQVPVQAQPINQDSNRVVDGAQKEVVVHSLQGEAHKIDKPSQQDGATSVDKGIGHDQGQGHGIAQERKPLKQEEGLSNQGIPVGQEQVPQAADGLPQQQFQGQHAQPVNINVPPQQQHQGQGQPQGQGQAQHQQNRPMA